MNTKHADTSWTIVSTYTRADALADGTLIAADPSLAIEAGWVHHVAYTAAVHFAVIAWGEAADDAKNTETGQDETGREWDVLCLAVRAARTTAQGEDRASFTVAAVPVTGDEVRPVGVDLIVHIGPGDTPTPVITIMLPNED